MAKENLDAFIRKISADKDFGDKVFNAETVEEVQQLAKNEAIELSSEDMQELQVFMKQVVECFNNQDNDELTDDDLDNVAGGLFVSSVSPNAIMSGGYTKDQLKNSQWVMGNGIAAC